MINPYQPIEITSDVSQPTARKDARLIWFAATVAGLVSVRFFYQDKELFSLIGAAEAILQSLQHAGPIVISGILMYAAMRHVFRLRFNYASSRLSLVCAGLIVSLYLIAVHHLDRQRPWTDDLAWLIGVVVGFPFGLCVAALERFVAKITDKGGYQSDSDDDVPVRSQTGHASIFWFSAATFVSIAALIPIGQPRRPDLYDIVETSAMVCLIFTAAYGLFSACLQRVHPATTAARVVAAVVYVGTVFGSSYLLSPFAPFPWLIPVLFVGPVFLAVPADRLVSRYAADR